MIALTADERSCLDAPYAIDRWRMGAATLGACLLCACALLTMPCHAAEASLASSPTSAVAEAEAPTPPVQGAHVVGSLLAGKPAVLGTGATMGVGAAWGVAGPVGWGIQSSWSTATEYTPTWTVTHSEWRVRGYGELCHRPGRGLLCVRGQIGTTTLWESRTRDQASRISTLQTGALDTSAVRLMPGAELLASIGLRVYESWGVQLQAGPSAHIYGGSLVNSWVGTLGVVWIP